MVIPSNLGQIEFLRSHPRILQLLIDRSKSKSLNPFIINSASAPSEGGFRWDTSYEEEALNISDFWSSILIFKCVDKFYDVYPYSEIHAVGKTIYCTTEEQRDHVENEGYGWILNPCGSYILEYTLSYQDFLQTLKNRENEKTTTNNSDEKKTIIDNVPPEKLEADQLEYQLEDDLAQWEADIKATSRAITAKKRELVQLKSAKTLSSIDIVKAIGELESLEKGLEILEAQKTELF